MIKNLTIEVSINKINKIFIEDFKKIVINNSGKCNLKFSVFDDKNFTLKLISLSYYVNPTNNFFRFIRNIGIYKYLIN
ncbi:MAG: hypothetical protein QMC32_01245 [Cytophagales bacterium]|jgi:hypothetical protein